MNSTEHLFGKLEASDYQLEKHNYEQKEEGGFSHNFKRDFQLFILWGNGRDKEKEVLKKISQKFCIIYCCEVHWSEKYNRVNFNRIYSESAESEVNLEKHKKAGMGPFLCIVVEDKNPYYGYIKSLSGAVFIGNTNVVKMKQRIREFLKGNLIHSSSSIREFYHHAGLIFHQKKLLTIIAEENWDGKIHQIKQDLAGAEGWESIREAFNMANYCSKWLVLRNYEYLPDDFWGNDTDIDILCENLPVFTSVLNTRKRPGNISAYEVLVEGKWVPLDIRNVGDNYYDSLWQKKMLERRLLYKESVPRLRDDDYFFSLLYHAKLQKPKVKDSYVPKLIQLARNIGLNNFDESTILNDKKASSLINGFMKEQGYHFYKPRDQEVYLNKGVYQYITEKHSSEKTSFKNQSVNLLFRSTPKFIKNNVSQNAKEKLRKTLGII